MKRTPKKKTKTPKVKKLTSEDLKKVSGGGFTLSVPEKNPTPSCTSCTTFKTPTTMGPTSG